MAANGGLLAGTQAYSLTLNTAGTAAIPASDITHAGITANTSPAIGVNMGTLAKLQVLAPGETAAPGSATGKTGAAIAQTAGIAFNVTVNAVDANWNLLTNATDAVGITSSDANASLPSNAALAGGTKAISGTVKTAGTAPAT